MRGRGGVSLSRRTAIRFALVDASQLKIGYQISSRILVPAGVKRCANWFMENVGGRGEGTIEMMAVRISLQ